MKLNLNERNTSVNLALTGLMAVRAGHKMLNDLE